MPDSNQVGLPPDLARTFEPVTRASHAPGALYTDPAVLQREMDSIFMREWLCLARSEEIASPGDYMTFQVGSEPVMICRDKDMAPRAYANMCPHRGAKLVMGQGNSRAFVCPYHAWSFNLDGRLIGASWMAEAEGFDKTTCHLHEFHLREWGGWLFVSVAPDPQPFEDYIAVFDQKFGYVKMENLKIGVRLDAELNCNWKLMVENFLDFYHGKILHKDTVGRFLSTPDVTYDLRPEGQVYVDHYDVGTLSKDGKIFKKRIPTMADKPELFAQAAALPPNLSVFQRLDYTVFFTSWPIGPNRMRMTTMALWQAEDLEGESGKKMTDEYIFMLNKVLQEDFDMVESLQLALQSTSFVPGRMSRLEQGVQHFVQHSIKRAYGDEDFRA
ncbi:aromatic ring-hydroxylating dioxygenase subunit alpha [Acidisoma cellulosilytica]|uniref:Aromatic ring-hydroxylating dioxygenase subunit alpha n=1 Tax=Acidisoma cellulosilyticum TaxID=2802395 RepID=A0A963Z3M2_9PROT|nr:aromatic ring-hydroxylating dioxygenase subunit alpha [Acidisoma cellulosilyticum]MCB8882157.1 aromatic ring-hydroxylating dioxygenase subunit alpha [Acidisoma cellulosilyticum]